MGGRTRNLSSEHLFDMIIMNKNDKQKKQEQSLVEMSQCYTQRIIGVLLDFISVYVWVIVRFFLTLSRFWINILSLWLVLHLRAHIVRSFAFFSFNLFISLSLIRSLCVAHSLLFTISFKIRFLFRFRCNFLFLFPPFSIVKLLFSTFIPSATSLHSSMFSLMFSKLLLYLVWRKGRDAERYDAAGFAFGNKN